MHEKLAKINILKNIDKMGTFWLQFLRRVKCLGVCIVLKV